MKSWGIVEDLTLKIWLFGEIGPIWWNRPLDPFAVIEWCPEGRSLKILLMVPPILKFLQNSSNKLNFHCLLPMHAWTILKLLDMSIPLTGSLSLRLFHGICKGVWFPEGGFLKIWLLAPPILKFLQNPSNKLNFYCLLSRHAWTILKLLDVSIPLTGSLPISLFQRPLHIYQPIRI